MIKFAFFDSGYQIKQIKRQFPICHIARTQQKLKLKAHVNLVICLQWHSISIDMSETE